MLKVLALIGFKKSGKTTSFEMISDYFLENEIFALKGESTPLEMQNAKRLKEACSEAFGLRYDYFESQKYKEKKLCVPMVLTKSKLSVILNMFNIDIETVDIERHIDMVFSTPRNVLQYVGTEVLREIDPDIHCRLVTQLAPKNGIVVITDNRFPSEIDFYSDFFKDDLTTVYIQNDKAEIEAFVDGEPHESERHIVSLGNNSNYVIRNNSSIEDLRAQLHMMLETLFL